MARKGLRRDTHVAAREAGHAHSWAKLTRTHESATLDRSVIVLPAMLLTGRRWPWHRRRWGYEDRSGFHFGGEPSLVPMAGRSRAVRRCREAGGGYATRRRSTASGVSARPGSSAFTDLPVGRESRSRSGWLVGISLGFCARRKPAMIVGDGRPSLKLKPNATARVLRGHPWVFANEVTELLPAELDGEVVECRDARGRLLGHAASTTAGRRSSGGG